LRANDRGGKIAHFDRVVGKFHGLVFEKINFQNCLVLSKKPLIRASNHGGLGSNYSSQIDESVDESKLRVRDEIVKSMRTIPGIKCLRRDRAKTERGISGFPAARAFECLASD
jgi:hypothetical protein